MIAIYNDFVAYDTSRTGFIQEQALGALLQKYSLTLSPNEVQFITRKFSLPNGLFINDFYEVISSLGKRYI